MPKFKDLHALEVFERTKRNKRLEKFVRPNFVGIGFSDLEEAQKGRLEEYRTEHPAAKLDDKKNKSLNDY